jgi:multiple sugar transport system ATP-binding protein
MGRAMVREPQAFLMDEPLSNLDAKLRVQMRAELARLHERLGTTTLYVTHDQIEAMTLGHRVAVLRDGTLQQIDTPQNLYSRPANLFVAAFIGSPPMNLVEATVTDGTVAFGEHHVQLPGTRELPGVDGGTVILGIRPADFEDADVWQDERRPTIEVIAEVTEELGSEMNVIFPVQAPPVLTEDTLAAATDIEDDAVQLMAEIHERARFCARVDARSRIRPGETARLSVDPARFHFFDPATGRAIEGVRAMSAPV